MSSKNRTSKAAVAVLETEFETTATLETIETAATLETELETATVETTGKTIVIAESPVSAPSSFKPVEKRIPGFLTSSERDRFGFAVGSYTSRIAALLSTDEGYLRSSLLRDALDVSEDAGAAVIRARKTTLSVFLSDSKRTPGIAGSYPVSRGFIYEEDEKGYLRISPETRDKALAAIAGGILSALKDAKTESARKAVVSRFGY